MNFTQYEGFVCITSQRRQAAASGTHVCEMALRSSGRRKRGLGRGHQLRKPPATVDGIRSGQKELEDVAECLGVI